MNSFDRDLNFIGDKEFKDIIEEIKKEFHNIEIYKKKYVLVSNYFHGLILLSNKIKEIYVIPIDISEKSFLCNNNAYNSLCYCVNKLITYPEDEHIRLSHSKLKKLIQRKFFLDVQNLPFQFLNMTMNFV